MASDEARSRLCVTYLYSTWLELGLDTAPFTVQSCAPMTLVHFYFSQLTLSCVFVVDKGRFTGMITKADIVRGGF